MPLQMMVAIDCVSRGHAYPEEARDVNFNPAGQVIGRATSVRRTKDVVLGMVEEYIDRGGEAAAGEQGPRRPDRGRRPRGGVTKTKSLGFVQVW